MFIQLIWTGRRPSSNITFGLERDRIRAADEGHKAKLKALLSLQLKESDALIDEGAFHAN